MNAYSRTLPMIGGPRVTMPARESGSSALDRRATWAAPDPTTMVLDPWGAPPPHSAIRTIVAPWPAPDPATRVPFRTPAVSIDVASRDVVVSYLVEPFHPIDMPDVSVLGPSFALDASPIPFGRPLPPPTLSDAAALVQTTPSAADRSGVRRRLAVGLAAAAGVACAAVAAAVALL